MMYKFRDLQKAAKIDVQGAEHKIAVLSNCSSQYLSQSIQGYGRLSGINMEIFDADYNQIDAQLIDPASEVYSFNPDEVMLWISTEKLYEEYLDMDRASRAKFADSYMQKLLTYWELVSRNTHARILQPNFTEIDDKVLGQYSSKVESTFTYQIRKLNYLVEEASALNAKVYLIDILAVQLDLGREVFFDSRLYYSSKMAVSRDALPYVAKVTVDVVKAILGRVKKCVVLDLDNTLWGGVIGDDGLSGIQIGELGTGHVYTNLQRWFKELTEYGTILTICSKNDETIAKEPFEKHDEMVLRLSDITVFVANWEDKASNIRLIQESLNVGLDSIVFIDDNPFERELVKEKLPEVEVPNLPEDPSEWLSFLQRNNYFETASYSSETSDRTKLYQAEFERKKLEHKFESIEEYLKNLNMIGMAEAFEPNRYPRIAQLTQRSNQFNLRTIRYTEDEIQEIAENPDYLTLFFTLRDKFGDHGLVSVVIMKKESNETIFIDTWLMSCRVLKRGMEEYVMNKIVQTADREGFSMIASEYIKTSKNAMVKDIYKTMGFSEISDGKYSLSIDEYVEKKTYIKDDSKQ